MFYLIVCLQSNSGVLMWKKIDSQKGSYQDLYDILTN